MKVLLTDIDIANNQILRLRNIKAGTTVETTHFFNPTLKLDPPAQDRVKKEVYTQREDVKEYTLEETNIEIITGNEGEGVVVVEKAEKVETKVEKTVVEVKEILVKKPVKKKVSKAKKSKNDTKPN